MACQPISRATARCGGRVRATCYVLCCD
uniref:Uncharacterized protein n=1 Tax=Arundo donax TaxID=35708 RepID=A0A0A9EAE3_ARUDO